MKIAKIIGRDMPIILKKFPTRRNTENLFILFKVSLFSEIQFFLMYCTVIIGTMMLMTKQHTPYTNMKKKEFMNVAGPAECGIHM